MQSDVLDVVEDMRIITRETARELSTVALQPGASLRRAGTSVVLQLLLARVSGVAFARHTCRARRLMLHVDNTLESSVLPSTTERGHAAALAGVA